MGPRPGTPPPPGAAAVGQGAFGATFSAWKGWMEGASLSMAFPATHPSTPTAPDGVFDCPGVPKAEGQLRGLLWAAPPPQSGSAAKQGLLHWAVATTPAGRCGVAGCLPQSPLSFSPVLFPGTSVWDPPWGSPLAISTHRATSACDPAGAWWGQHRDCGSTYVEWLN